MRPSFDVHFVRRQCVAGQVRVMFARALHFRRCAMRRFISSLRRRRRLLFHALCHHFTQAMRERSSPKRYFIFFAFRLSFFAFDAAAMITPMPPVFTPFSDIFALHLYALMFPLALFVDFLQLERRALFSPRRCRRDARRF